MAPWAVAAAATTGSLAGRTGPIENPLLVRRDGVEENHLRCVSGCATILDEEK